MELEKREESCPTIYGPVKSRRHGLSLGVNLGLVEHKVCTWGCVYCQCGMGERREIRPEERNLEASTILLMLREAIEKNPKIDSITFAGNSEPCAHPDFKKTVTSLIQLRKELNQKWIINVLSNGSELDRDEVIEACNLIDEAWIKLDCSVDSQFQRLSRPIAKVGRVTDHITRISKLNKIFIQTLVWQCPSNEKLSNWTSENREGLIEIYKKIKPKVVHLTTIARSPAVSELEPVLEDELNDFANRIRALGIQVDVFK